MRAFRWLVLLVWCALAASAAADETYTNAHPPPEGGSLGGKTVGPSYATDAFHIDWDRFCVAQSAHCTNGEPHYAQKDAAMVANTLPTSFYGAGVTRACTTAAASIIDNQDCGDATGVYYAKTSDWLVTITCVVSCANGPSGISGNLSGAQIYIPRGAIAEPGSDGHLIVKEPSGVICQLGIGHGAQSVTSKHLNIMYGACGPSDESNEGSVVYGAYASNDEISRGLVRPEDIVGNNGDGTDSGDASSFYHALYGSFTNNVAGYVWPAIYGDGYCKAHETVNGVSPKEGMVLYLDRAGFRVVEAWSPPIYLRWLKRALGTLHRHGMIDSDSAGCADKVDKLYVSTAPWGSQSYAMGGGASPLDAYLPKYMHPYESLFSSPARTRERAVYSDGSNGAYALDFLWYEDVPGLSASNFHWLASGCGQTAVQGKSSDPC